MRNSLKIILANVGGVLLVIALFDIVMYKLLPTSYTTGFKEYRKEPSPDVPGRSEYPQHYFVEHPRRGFDIGPGQQGYHWVEGVDYPIWSNTLGCFDGEHPRDSDYVYFAGDSFTWGYTPYEQKFGTLVEQKSGAAIFKCGVTHTGQRHQFEKFRDIVEQHGHAPKAVFVFYSANDVANDYAHPHSTIMRGWQIDSAGLDPDNNIVRLTEAELNQKIEDGLAKMERRRRLWWQSAAKPLLRYSLSASIINTISEKAQDSIELKRQQDKAAESHAELDHSHAEKTQDNTPATTKAKDASELAAAVDSKQAPTARRPVRNLYYLPASRTNEYWYRNNPYAEANKQALLDFKTFAEQRGIELVVVLIPGKNLATDTRWYHQLHSFLKDRGIEYLDLAAPFKERELRSEEIYWVFDGHFSPAGNKLVADILIERYPQMFQPGG